MTLMIRREHWTHNEETWTTTDPRTSEGVTAAADIEEIIRAEYQTWGADDHDRISDTEVKFVKRGEGGDPFVQAWQRITILGAVAL